jgi:hypothetical protein
LGQVNTNQEIHAETYHADLGFLPSPTASLEHFQKLGLLGKMVRTTCLLEYFWKPPTLAEVRGGLLKLFSWHSQWLRETKKMKRLSKLTAKQSTEKELPRLWIVTTTIPNIFFSRISLKQLPEWGQGVYLADDILKTAIVAIDQLPTTPETVWLRLLGRGQIQEQAVTTVLAWMKTDPSWTSVLETIYKWCSFLDAKPHLTEAEKELLMNLETAYQEARQRAIQQGILQGIQQGVEQGIQQGVEQGILQGIQQGIQQGRLELVENLLQSRFGELDRDLLQVIDSLVQLPPAELTDYVLQWSRKELIAKFGKKRRTTGH